MFFSPPGASAKYKHPCAGQAVLFWNRSRHRRCFWTRQLAASLSAGGKGHRGGEQGEANRGEGRAGSCRVFTHWAARHVGLHAQLFLSSAKQSVKCAFAHPPHSKVSSDAKIADTQKKIELESRLSSSTFNCCNIYFREAAALLKDFVALLVTWGEFET